MHTPIPKEKKDPPVNSEVTIYRLSDEELAKKRSEPKPQGKRPINLRGSWNAG